MDISFLRALEAFWTGADGILVFYSTTLLAGFSALLVLAAKRPRWEWKRAALTAGLLLVLLSAALLADWVSVGLPASPFKSIAANFDRASEFLLCLAFGWFFLFPRSSRGGNALFAVLGSLAFLGVLVTSASFFYFGAEFPFNANWISLIWDSLRILLLIGLILVLLVRRPAYWGVSLLAFLLLLAGAGLQSALGDVTTYLPGLARLLELLAYPLVAMRLALAVAAGGALEAGASEIQTTRRAASLSVRELVDLLLTEDAADLPGAIAQWLCSALDADVAFVVAPAESKDGVLFVTGYDRTQAKALPSFTIPADAAGQLLFALDGRQPLRLERMDSQPTLDAIASSAGFAQAGTGLFAPMGITESLTLGGLLISPYKAGEWSAEDGELLGMLVQAGTAAFQRLHDEETLRNRLQTSEQQTSQALTEGEHLQQEILSLEMQVQQAREEWQKERQRAEGLAVLIKEQDFQPGPETAASGQLSSYERRIAEATAHEKATITRLEEELESTRVELSNALQDSRKLPEAIAAAASFREESLRLQEELRSARGQAAGAATGEDFNRLQGRLAETETQARKEIERLQGELRRTLTEYNHLQSALLQPPPQPEAGLPAGPETGADTTMVSSLISEIRQPLSSMVGYADLLLSESAGILGAMQRKFLERIRASINRTEALFEDLLQVILLPGKVSAPRIQPVDVATLIDSAVSGVSDAVREKNLILRLDLDEEMPPVEMDRDALQQIINHLVQNAVLATVPEKEVVLTAHAPLSDRESRRALLLTVKDNGPGISAEDQPRVFTRLYRAEGPLIDGLGDSGVGMAVARTLTESLGGRIWLESQPGAGTTFFVLLPVQPGGLAA